MIPTGLMVLTTNLHANVIESHVIRVQMGASFTLSPILSIRHVPTRTHHTLGDLDLIRFYHLPILPFSPTQHCLLHECWGTYAGSTERRQKTPHTVFINNRVEKRLSSSHIFQRPKTGEDTPQAHQRASVLSHFHAVHPKRLIFHRHRNVA